jgi:hypothetical protein
VEVEVLKTSGDVLVFEGGNLRGPRRIKAQVRDGDVEAEVDIAYVKAEGRYVVQAVRGATLTSEILHALRPPEIVREAVLEVLFGSRWSVRVYPAGEGPTNWTDPPMLHVQGEIKARGWLEAYLWARLRGKPSPLDDAPDARKVEIVALVYQFAYMVGQRPTATVTKAFGLPRSTAGRLIRQARDQGLLGPTTERKAGV